MQRLAILFLLLFSSSPVFSQKTILNTTLLDLDGNTKELKSLVEPGKPTVISFWASWCKPCLEEIISLDKIIKEQKLEVNFILINTDEVRSLSKAKTISKQKRWSAHLLFDTNQDYMRALGVISLPKTYLYDKTGLLKASFNAYSKGDENNYVDLLK
jgi:cytochrome c biogenesis protein CcmG, thiol:disulfide interchange protein DsbE